MMAGLSYLKNEKKVPGDKSFVTHVDFQVENGIGNIWIYELFPGVQLMLSEFQCDSCFRNVERENNIGINHCKRGRFECIFRNQRHLYMDEGDIAINSQKNQVMGSTFPLKYFYGTTIILQPEEAMEGAELEIFQIDPKELEKKYLLDCMSHVFRRNEELEHVYQELYSHLEHCPNAPELPFLQLKVLELLYHFQCRQIVLKENREYLSGELVEKIKHVKEHLTGDLENRILLRDLAQEHNLSLTQLKEGFRKIYGTTPYAYLRNYKMNVAAHRLRESNDKISDIALDLGYHNPSKFSQSFYKVIGKKPKEYRKEK